MKIIFVGHASLLIEAGGVTVLSDLLVTETRFGAQRWLYPDPYLEALDNQRIDYIYISMVIMTTFIQVRCTLFAGIRKPSFPASLVSGYALQYDIVYTTQLPYLKRSLT